MKMGQGIVKERCVVGVDPMLTLMQESPPSLWYFDAATQTISNVAPPTYDRRTWVHTIHYSTDSRIDRSYVFASETKQHPYHDGGRILQASLQLAHQRRYRLVGEMK